MAEEDGDMQDKARDLESIFKTGRIPGKDRRLGVKTDGQRLPIGNDRY